MDPADLTFTLHEPDVAITDLLLSLFCLYLFIRTFRSLPSTSGERNLWLLLFSSVGAAAFLGGVTHGFLPDPGHPLHVIFWDAIFISIGLTGLSCWLLAAFLLDPGWRPILTRASVALLGLYILVVLFLSRSFLVPVLYYLPALLLLGSAFLRAQRSSPARWKVLGLWGCVLALLAAFVQQAGIGLHPLYFGHNAFYHLLQACSLGCLAQSAVLRHRDREK